MLLLLALVPNGVQLQDIMKKKLKHWLSIWEIENLLD